MPRAGGLGRARRRRPEPGAAAPRHGSLTSMGIESPVHLLFLAAVALLVLGPKRLPDLAKALGDGIREFRESISAGEDEHEARVSPNGAPAATPVPAPQQPAAASGEPHAAGGEPPAAPADEAPGEDAPG